MSYYVKKFRTRLELQAAALKMMARYGEVEKRTTVLHLHDGKGGVTEKPFILWHSVPTRGDEVGRQRTKVPQNEIPQGLD